MRFFLYEFLYAGMIFRFILKYYTYTPIYKGFCKIRRQISITNFIVWLISEFPLLLEQHRAVYFSLSSAFRLPKSYAADSVSITNNNTTTLLANNNEKAIQLLTCETFVRKLDQNLVFFSEVGRRISCN